MASGLSVRFLVMISTAIVGAGIGDEQVEPTRTPIESAAAFAMQAPLRTSRASGTARAQTFHRRYGRGEAFDFRGCDGDVEAAEITVTGHLVEFPAIDFGACCFSAAPSLPTMKCAVTVIPRPRQSATTRAIANARAAHANDRDHVAALPWHVCLDPSICALRRAAILRASRSGSEISTSFSSNNRDGIIETGSHMAGAVAIRDGDGDRDAVRCRFWTKFRAATPPSVRHRVSKPGR